MKTILSCLLLGSAWGVAAADYVVVGQATGGGGEAAGGVYALRGVFGEPSAGESVGGTYTVKARAPSGVFAIPTPGAPQLTVRLVEGQVVLTWAVPAEGFILEETPDWSSSSGWTAVNVLPLFEAGQASVTLGPATGFRFLRLRRP